MHSVKNSAYKLSDDEILNIQACLKHVKCLVPNIVLNLFSQDILLKL